MTAASPTPAASCQHLPWQMAGERVELLGERALYWPARRCLFIADLHLGKGDTLRRGGIALPRGGTGDDLARLGRLIDDTGADSLVVLGDLVHGPVRPGAWLDQWAQWRQQRRALDVRVVPGNHDRALRMAADQPARLDPTGHRNGDHTAHEATDHPGHHSGDRTKGKPRAHSALLPGVRLLDPQGHAADDGPFALRHSPEHADLTRHTLCGHLHPVARLPGVPRRWPAFWLRPGLTVLPAFSAATGGWLLPAPQAAATSVLCVHGAPVPWPSAPGARPDGRDASRMRRLGRP